MTLTFVRADKVTLQSLQCELYISSNPYFYVNLGEKNYVHFVIAREMSLYSTTIQMQEGQVLGSIF
jgi:hypothetical protein